jgi:hypothetical protein
MMTDDGTPFAARRRKRMPAMNSNHPSSSKIEVTRDGLYHVTGSLPLEVMTTQVYLHVSALSLPPRPFR